MTKRRRARVDGTRIAIGCLSAAFIVVVSVSVAWWAFLLRPQSTAEPGTPVQIEIDAGSSTAEIARELVSAGVVPNGNMFRLRARIQQADGKLKAGVYDVMTGMTYEDAILFLVEGPEIRFVTVTIPEGWVIEQIAARLSAQAGVVEKEFVSLAKSGAREFQGEFPFVRGAYGGSLEGYLFPKTYRIKEGATSDEVIRMMLRQFEKEIETVDLSSTSARGLNLAQTITIASMIERETRLPKERPLVSSVINNRLARGMYLEIDATIEYVLPGNRFRLLNKHLKIDSPYNTYRNKGLPPGPICNPGLPSIEAAVAPARTNHAFYVLTGRDGSHTFVDTQAEFLRAKQKSKEVFGR